MLAIESLVAPEVTTEWMDGEVGHLCAGKLETEKDKPWTAVEPCGRGTRKTYHNVFPNPTRSSLRLSGRDEAAFRVDPLLRFGTQFQ